MARLAERQETSLEKFEKAASGLFTRDIRIGDETLTPNTALARLEQQFGGALAQLNQAITGARAADAFAPGDAGLKDLLGKRDALRSNYTDALDAILETSKEAVRDASRALESALGDFPPEARAVLRRAIINGTTDAARAFESVFGGLPAEGARSAFGIESLRPEEQRAQLGRLVQDQLASIQGTERFGDVYSLGLRASTRDVLGLRRLTPRQGGRRALAFYRGEALPEADGLLRRAVDSLGDNPSELSIANVRAAQIEVAALGEAVRRLEYELNPARQAFDDFASGVRNSLENNVADALTGLIDGTSSLKDALRGLASDVIRIFAQVQARLLVQNLVGDFGTPLTGGGVAGLSGLIGGLFGRGSGAPSTPSFGSGFIATAAHGGVFPGTFIPTRAFAQGGIVRRPTFGLIGENHAPEAVIPLQGGTVPVQFVGTSRGRRDTEGQQVFLIVPDEATARARGYQQDRDIILDTVVGNIVAGGRVAKVLRRRA